MMNRRYSLLRGSPSSKTTIEATTSVPWRLEMSKHSIRSGEVGRSSASGLFQSPIAGGQIPGPCRLVPNQRLSGIPGDGVHQRPLVASLRHSDLHCRTTAFGEQPGQ